MISTVIVARQIGLGLWYSSKEIASLMALFRNQSQINRLHTIAY